jgi:predicted dinucleotide-binding enzyme
MSSTKTLKVAIIGTGLQGQGLAALCNATGAVSNYSIVLGSRNPSVDRYRRAAVPVVEIDTALHGAQIVILAIPPINFPEFMEKHSLMLPNNAVIVDMSNPTGGEAAAIVESGSFCSGSSRVKSDHDASITSRSVTIDAGEISNDGELIRPPIQLSVAEWLQSRAHDRFVVKAFTNIRFQMHTHAMNFHGALHTVAASDSREALEIFQRFASACGIVVRIVPALAFARTVERYQRQPAFAAWRQPFAVFAILFLLHYIYCAAKTRNFPFGNGVQNVNSALAWSALTGLSLTVLPGRIILPALKLVTGNHVLVLPRWIKIWMQARREIGLLATFAATLHVLVCFET